MHAAKGEHAKRPQAAYPNPRLYFFMKSLCKYAPFKVQPSSLLNNIISVPEPKAAFLVCLDQITMILILFSYLTFKATEQSPHLSDLQGPNSSKCFV